MRDPLHVGFTGTRQGMTTEQMVYVLKLLASLRPDYVHHGDCIGADEEFHVLSLLAKVPTIAIHPPDNPKARAYCLNLKLCVDAIYKKGTVRLHEEKSYHARNDDIVSESAIIIATPSSSKEQQQGSGTWSTMRKTLKAEKDLITVWPNGTQTIGDWRD